MSDIERDDPDNLILVCPSHHREIDAHPDIWTVDRLRQIKAHHEEWIQQQLEGFASWDPDTYRRDANGPRVAIGLERSEIGDGTPRYTFAVRNAGPDAVVVHSVQADILALDVCPSVRLLEEWTSTMMLRMRTGVTFDLRRIASAHASGPWQLDADDTFELAIDLELRERHAFVASLRPGDFCAGMFRLIARYWDWPDHQFAATTPTVGVFEVPDEGDASTPPARGRAAILDIASLSQLADPTAQIDGWGTRRALAQRALGRVNSPEAHDVIERWLDEPSRSQAALTAVQAAWQGPWRTMMIDRALSSDDPIFRAQAVHVIDMTHESAVYEALGMRALDDPDPHVREAAVAQLQTGFSPRLDRQLSGY